MFNIHQSNECVTITLLKICINKREVHIKLYICQQVILHLNDMSEIEFEIL